MTNEHPDRLTRILIAKLLDEKMPRAGSYACDVAFGRAALSGADLRGRAATYGARYAKTRLAVIHLIVGAGLARIAIGPHGRRYFEYDQ